MGDNYKITLLKDSSDNDIYGYIVTKRDIDVDDEIRLATQYLDNDNWCIDDIIEIMSHKFYLEYYQLEDIAYI